LRFDDSGRLWIHVQRGAPSETVFDLFDASGAFIGEVKLNRNIRDFALGAGMLAAITESAGGAEQVVTWRIHQGATEKGTPLSAPPSNNFDL
jgi:hypothetical protein